MPGKEDHLRDGGEAVQLIVPHVLLTIDAEGPLGQVDFDPTGPRVVLSGSDGLAEIWDVESGERLVVLAGPPGGVKDLVFSPDGSSIATASADGLVRLFDADTGAQQLGLRGSEAGRAITDEESVSISMWTGARGLDRGFQVSCVQGDAPPVSPERHRSIRMVSRMPRSSARAATCCGRCPA